MRRFSRKDVWLCAALSITAFYGAPLSAGCDPCICGEGGGRGIPDECYNRPPRSPRPSEPVQCSGDGRPVFAGLRATVRAIDFNDATPVNPCANQEGWRAAVCGFAEGHLVHPAWGYEHGLRDYTLATMLARAEDVAVDDDVVFAAAMLHDMGGFAPYEVQGVDHALRSTQVVDQVLNPAGFPVEKVEAVKAAILHHSYYDHVMPESNEGVVLHDADGLDFVGGVAVMRILGIVGREDGTPDIGSALTLLRALKDQVPATMYGGVYTKDLLAHRVSEVEAFLTQIQQEAFGFGVPQS
jgi:hypothetical protein